MRYRGLQLQSWSASKATLWIWLVRALCKVHVLQFSSVFLLWVSEWTTRQLLRQSNRWAWVHGNADEVLVLQYNICQCAYHWLVSETMSQGEDFGQVHVPVEWVNDDLSVPPAGSDMAKAMKWRINFFAKITWSNKLNDWTADQPLEKRWRFLTCTFCLILLRLGIHILFKCSIKHISYAAALLLVR